MHEIIHEISHALGLCGEPHPSVAFLFTHFDIVKSALHQVKWAVINRLF